MASRVQKKTLTEMLRLLAMHLASYLKDQESSMGEE